MKLFAFLLLVIFTLSCSKNNALSINILNDSVKYPIDSIFIEIKNHTSKDYLFILDEKAFARYNFYYTPPFRINQIVIKENGFIVENTYTIPTTNYLDLLENKTKFFEGKSKYDSLFIKKYKLKLKKDSLDEKEISEILLNRNSILNSKLIPKHASIIIKIPSVLNNEIRNDSELLYNFNLYKNENYFLYLKYSISKKNYYFNKEELDSLNKKKIYIYSGQIYSNKVPIIIH